MRKIFIIKDILEQSNINETVLKIGKIIGAKIKSTDIKASFRLGRNSPASDNARPRPILVKTTQAVAFTIISNGRKLRHNDDFNKVYVDRDWPPHIANGLAALRKRAFDHRKAHPGSSAFVQRGKLIIDGNVADSVNIGNQLFREQ